VYTNTVTGNKVREKSPYTKEMDRYKKHVRRQLYSIAWTIISQVFNRILNIPNVDINKYISNDNDIIQIDKQQELFKIIIASGILSQNGLNNCRLLIAHMDIKNKIMFFTNDATMMEEIDFYRCIITFSKKNKIMAIDEGLPEQQQVTQKKSDYVATQKVKHKNINTNLSYTPTRAYNKSSSKARREFSTHIMDQPGDLITNFYEDVDDEQIIENIANNTTEDNNINSNKIIEDDNINIINNNIVVDSINDNNDISNDNINYPTTTDNDDLTTNIQSLLPFSGSKRKRESSVLLTEDIEDVTTDVNVPITNMSVMFRLCSQILQKLFNYKYESQQIQLSLEVDECLINTIIYIALNNNNRNAILIMDEFISRTHWTFKTDYSNVCYNDCVGNGICMLNSHYQALCITKGDMKEMKLYQNITLSKDFLDILLYEQRELKKLTILRNKFNEKELKDYSECLDRSILSFRSTLHKSSRIATSKLILKPEEWPYSTCAGIPFYLNEYESILSNSTESNPPIELFPQLFIYQFNESKENNKLWITLMSAQPASCIINNVETINKENPIQYMDNFTLSVIETAIINRGNSLTLANNHWFPSNILINHNNFKLAKTQICKEIIGILDEFISICNIHQLNTHHEISNIVKSASFFYNHSDRNKEAIIKTTIISDYASWEIGKYRNIHTKNSLYMLT
jgi:hypothetical protein